MKKLKIPALANLAALLFVLGWILPKKITRILTFLRKLLKQFTHARTALTKALTNCGKKPNDAVFAELKKDLAAIDPPVEKTAEKQD